MGSALEVRHWAVDPGTGGSSGTVFRNLSSPALKLSTVQPDKRLTSFGRWACRQAAVLALAVFVGVGFYGVFHLLFGAAPPPRVTFLRGNASAPGSGGSGVGEDRSLTSSLQVGEILPNCGLQRVCPADHFPVHVYSGKTKDDHPRVCVSGRYVIEWDINNGGRGINLVIVDPRWMKAVIARRFDTYARDSSELETFLRREVREGDILLAVTFDEASRNLSPAARNILAELGSSQIQNLQFRGQWYMVTQRGMKGFSPHEALHAAKGGVWSPVDERLCVSRQLKGRAIMPDPPVLQNPDRLKFCEARPHVSDFCSVHQRDSPLRPAILTNRQLVGSAMFTTPIVVLAPGGGCGGACSVDGGPGGGDGPLSALALTLQTLLGQPGVQSKYVLVLYDPRVVPDAAHLCSLFHFPARPIVRAAAAPTNASLEYYEVMRAAFETARTTFPASPLVTIIEGGLLLAPDFLAYTASMLPLLHDPSVLAVSAWNPNGYPSVSTRPDLAYRAEEFPGLAFTLRMATYTKELKDHMKTCCNGRGWEGWHWDGRGEREVVMPDVSRVLRRPLGCDLEPATPLIKALFHRLRATNLEMSAPIQNTDSLAAHRYEAHLAALLNTSSSLVLTPGREEVNRCANEQDPSHLSDFNRIFLNATEETRPKVVVLPYKEEGEEGYEGMRLLCRCFGLFHHPRERPRGLHRGLLRFSMHGSQIFLLTNHSPHFSLPPYATTTTLALP